MLEFNWPTDGGCSQLNAGQFAPTGATAEQLHSAGLLDLVGKEAGAAVS